MIPLSQILEYGEEKYDFFLFMSIHVVYELLKIRTATKLVELKKILDRSFDAIWYFSLKKTLRVARIWATSGLF